MLCCGFACNEGFALSSSWLQRGTPGPGPAGLRAVLTHPEPALAAPPAGHPQPLPPDPAPTGGQARLKGLQPWQCWAGMHTSHTRLGVEGALDVALGRACGRAGLGGGDRLLPTRPCPGIRSLSVALCVCAKSLGLCAALGPACRLS